MCHKVHRFTKSISAQYVVYVDDLLVVKIGMRINKTLPKLKSI